MTAFIIVAVVGVLLLLLSLVLDDFLGGVLEGVDFTGGYLSTSAIAAFMATFGLAGALWMGRSESTGQSILVGIVAGLAVGGLAGFVTRSMINAPTDRTPTPADAVGALGVVVTAIPDDGFGEVNIRIAGAPLKLNARADAALPIGTEVVVTASLSATSVRVHRRPTT